MPLNRPISVTYSEDDLRRNLQKDQYGKIPYTSEKTGNVDLRSEITTRPLNNSNASLHQNGFQKHPKSKVWTESYSPPKRKSKVPFERTDSSQRIARTSDTATHYGHTSRSSTKDSEISDEQSPTVPNSHFSGTDYNSNHKKSPIKGILKNPKRNVSRASTTGWSESSTSIPDFHTSDSNEFYDDDDKLITSELLERERWREKKRDAFAEKIAADVTEKGLDLSPNFWNARSFHQPRNDSRLSSSFSKHSRKWDSDDELDGPRLDSTTAISPIGSLSPPDGCQNCELCKWGAVYQAKMREKNFEKPGSSNLSKHCETLEAYLKKR